MSDERAKALEAAALIADDVASHAFDDCERNVGPCPETGAYECSLERTGRDCLCIQTLETAEKIAASIRALNTERPA
ncbi:hypothetical protein [Ancylobacter sp. SL191]|uniref:hypothetical protein n=1 Tax=Ancylobacter sp. SL191 TaxID=2995166 RepID=UPI00227032F8|nr:hypothetical protein [Ancylobacter sp. SL191]WAC26335.1 hypothetical protein OU996_15115 [Ancylobacter sp. SL191]